MVSGKERRRKRCRDCKNFRPIEGKHYGTCAIKRYVKRLYREDELKRFVPDGCRVACTRYEEREEERDGDEGRRAY